MRRLPEADEEGKSDNEKDVPGPPWNLLSVVPPFVILPIFFVYGLLGEGEGGAMLGPVKSDWDKKGYIFVKARRCHGPSGRM